MNLTEAYHDPLQPAVPSGRMPLDVYQVEEGVRECAHLDTSVREVYLHAQSTTEIRVPNLVRPPNHLCIHLEDYKSCHEVRQPEGVPIVLCLRQSQLHLFSWRHC